MMAKIKGYEKEIRVLGTCNSGHTIIFEDDHCLVCANRHEDNEYVITHHWTDMAILEAIKIRKLEEY